MSAQPEGFPSLKPAFVQTLNISYDDICPLGKVYNGSECNYIALKSGSIVSVDGFEPKLDLKLISGGDYMYFDPSEEKKARINAKAVFKTPEGTMVSLSYTGCIFIDEKVQKIFEGQPATVPFGYSTSNHTFETGDPKYKFLENGQWTANGRFVFENGVFGAESRTCQVVPSTENPPVWKA